MPSPPIVMVRVLQDTMAQLFKLNAELEGMEALEKEQSNQLNALWSGLKTLAANQAEFQELTRALARASGNAEQWSKTAVAEGMSARFDEAKISAIRIVLPAFPPTNSTFPGYPILGLLAILGGIFSGTAVALALEFLFRRPTPKLRSA
jgi:uncharacterized protein involved in exopolysaccharide biosynthesis